MAARIRTLLAMALAIALMSLASAVPVLSQDDDDETETLRVKVLDRKEELIEVDANDSGEVDEGDYDVASAPVFKGGEKVGNERHTCVNAPAGNKAFITHCRGTFTIEGRGSLEVGGTVKFQRGSGLSSNLAILGGTGKFREAEGTVKLEEGKRSTTFVFRIIT